MKLFLKILIVALVGFAVYQSRWVFSFKYDPEYYENFYYESQYAYPSSARGISDGTLYKFVGYRLTQGENPFNINWEIPPLGKALYGYSSRFIGNPYWFSLVSFLASLVIFFVFISRNFKNSAVPFIGVVMLILIPHFTNQISDTMLDLPLTLAYLIHIFFFFDYIDKKKIKRLILAGVFLGVAAAIKPPVYILFILLSELMIVYLNERNNPNGRRWKKVLVLPVSVFAGYVLGYFVYFMRHPNPIPWLRLHQKIYDFYLGSNLNVFHPVAIKEIFNLGSWGFFYIAGLICYFIAWFKYFKNRKDLKLLTLILFSTVFLVINSYISFFPRYLLPLSFVFVSLILYVFKNKLAIPVLICILSIPFFYKSFELQNPDGDALAAARFIGTRADRELYRSINPDQLKGISENDFINTLENFNNTLGTRKIQVTVGKRSKSAGKYYYDFKIEYFTRSGVIENDVPFEYENIGGQWKLNWSWDGLYKNYTPGSSVEFVRLPGSPVAEYEVYVIPRLMYDWIKSLDVLSYLTGMTTVAINKNLTSVVPNDFERFVGYLDKGVSARERDRVVKENGAVRIREVTIDLNLERESNFIK